MESVLRAAITYAFLLLLFRITGKRGLAQITTFDFILLLIIGEATQNAMLADDYSLTNGLLLIATLIAIDLGLSLVKARFPALDRWLEDLPLVVVEKGRPLRDRLGRARIDEEDVLEAARAMQGLERMDQIEYAVLERNGGISVIPKQTAAK